MASSFGRCANLDYCTLAANRRDIEVPLGMDFICPECGRPLRAPPQKTGGSGGLIAAALGGVVVLAAIGGTWFVARGGSHQTEALGTAAGPAPTKPPTVVATPAPNPSPPQATQLAVPATAPAPPPPGPDIILRLAGSDIVGAGLAPQLASAFLLQAGDADIKITPGGGPRDAPRDASRDAPGETPAETLVIGDHNGHKEAIAIDNTTAADGFSRLQAGRADMAMSARQLTEAEHDALAPLGDMNTPAAEHVVAVDALVLVANAANPLRSLTTEQVRGLLSGGITNWSQLGAKPAPVTVYAPDRTSETGAAISRLALRGATMAPGAKDLAGDAQIAEAVSNDAGGIGVLTLPPLLLHSRYAVQVRPLAIADTGSPALAPSNRPAVETLDYPYAFRLYMYLSPNAPTPLAKRFIDFVGSRDGEVVADGQGLISQSVAPQELILPDTVSNRFRQFVEGAKLLAVHFRFKSNSAELDVDGQRDLDRIVNYLVANRYSGDNLILAGFADNHGSASANNALSLKRAQALAALLAERGLKPSKVAGFGSELPLTENNTEEGRQRNRRVEAYLLP
jgi:phosphate transport system substrate-binding protein